MKKAYVAPKVERMAFAYEEIVVASEGQCIMQLLDKYQEKDSYTTECRDKYMGVVSIFHGEQS